MTSLHRCVSLPFCLAWAGVSLFSVLATPHADAAIEVAIDLDLTTPGIQDTAQGFVGDTITGGIVLTLVDDDGNPATDQGLAGLRIDLLFDTETFSLGPQPFSRPNPTPPPFGNVPSEFEITPVRGPSNNDVLVQLGEVELRESNVPFTLPSGQPEGAFANIALGSSNSGVGDGTSQVFFEFALRVDQRTSLNPQQNLVINADPDRAFLAFDNSIRRDFTLSGATIVAVPEPSSAVAVLLGGGSVTAVRRRRRNKRSS